jgi:hydrogenase expression/formation protein HypC
MCLGVPGQIIALDGREATVDFWGVKRIVRLDHLEDVVERGDYIVDHAGFAVRRIPPADVADTLALYEILLTEAGEDPIARDVAAELERETSEVAEGDLVGI